MSRIFQPREVVKRQQRQTEVIGRFRSGYQMGDRPAALREWRVTTADRDVAERIIDLLGSKEAEPQEWDSKGEDNLEVFTTSSKVEVILSGDDAIDARMVVFTRGQDRLFVCKGQVYEPEKSEPFVCEADDFSTKAEHRANRHVCEPLVKVRFRLAADPGLGLFEFQTGSWSFAMGVGGVRFELQKVGGPARATLALEKAEFERDGELIKFTKPVLNVLGPAEEVES